MLGRKMTAGKSTPDTCLIVVVGTKVQRAKLSKSDRIPASVRLDGKQIPTDVLPLGRFLPQSLDTIRFCSDGRTRATVTAFARSIAGPVGVTCAHALAGPDRAGATSDPIGLWSPERSDYVTAGRSGPSVWHAGLGVASDFGFADVGLFTLDSTDLKQMANQLPPMRIVVAPRDGMVVFADTGHGRISGEIHAVQAILGTMRCDVVVRADPPGTFEGDSGAVWRTAQGSAAAIHALGSPAAPGQGSTFSAAMLVSRAARLLNVEFLEG